MSEYASTPPLWMPMHRFVDAVASRCAPRAAPACRSKNRNIYGTGPAQ